jgi:hypothetical protein
MLAVLLTAGGESGEIGAACVTPQTTEDIKPAKIEKVIRLIAILPEREP